MANYIIDFLDSNNILYEYQYGFTKGHSTNYAVISLVERVSKALDTGTSVIGVYRDIRTAFEAIDHAILIQKLYSLEIHGNLYNNNNNNNNTYLKSNIQSIWRYKFSKLSINQIFTVNVHVGPHTLHDYDLYIINTLESRWHEMWNNKFKVRSFSDLYECLATFFIQGSISIITAWYIQKNTCTHS